ncbi:MAG TPA: DNA polymerase IV [Aeromicrobium sp.]|nr:DNA polymerase IV [Aeromicrobium sp.]
MTEGTVLHADLDSFFASVEQRDDPSLRGKPVIVGGGVVLAASYEAKAFGVQGAMGGRQARRLCPDAIVVPPRFHAYVEASRQVFDIFRDVTPQVEGMSIDEAFLEVGGLRRLRGEPSLIATDLRAAVRERAGLPISVGVARTKHLAKIASGMCKPDGLLVVPIESELTFLHSLPVERIWGVGPATAAKLHTARLTTVAQLARFEVSELSRLVGPAAAHHLHALAHNRDPRRVHAGTSRRSIGSQSAIGRGPHSDEQLDRTLQTLVDRVTRRLRSAGRTGSTVVLRLRFDDFTRSTTSHSLPRPTDNTGVVLETARQLLARRLPEIHQRGCTLVGITLSGLDAHAAQLMLPLGTTDDGSVDAAVDAVRNRFGSDAIRPGSLSTRRSARSAEPALGRAPGP